MKSNLDDVRITEAIDTYPIQPLPSGFVKSVLGQIESNEKLYYKNIFNANSEFSYSVAPIVFLWLAFSIYLLAKFNSLWLDPIKANYYRSLYEYWKMQYSYSGISTLSVFSLIAGILILSWLFFSRSSMDHLKGYLT